MQNIHYKVILVLVSSLIVTNIKFAKTIASFLLLWLYTIFVIMVLWIIDITGDLARIFPFYISERFGIIFSSWDTTILILLLVIFPWLCLFLIFLSFINAFCLLLNLSNLTLVLRDQVWLLGFFKLIIRVDTYL